MASGISPIQWKRSKKSYGLRDTVTSWQYTPTQGILCNIYTSDILGKNEYHWNLHLTGSRINYRCGNAFLSKDPCITLKEAKVKVLKCYIAFMVNRLLGHDWEMQHI